LSERGPQGGLYFILGDFTGHGLAASLGTLPVSQTFFQMAKKGRSVSEIARRLNYELKKILPVGMFFAANIIMLDPACSFMTIWSGGLLDGFHFDIEGNEKSTIPSCNLPLGVLPEIIFKGEVKLISVEKGDMFYFYSDGITEAQNKQGAMFGDKLLHQSLFENKTNRIDSLVETLDKFCSGCQQKDDITIVELTCDKIPPEEKENTILLEDHAQTK